MTTEILFDQKEISDLLEYLRRAKARLANLDPEGNRWKLRIELSVDDDGSFSSSVTLASSEPFDLPVSLRDPGSKPS